MNDTATANGAFEFRIRDLVYQNHGSKDRLARLYQPAGIGPFPAVLQIHGGAWNSKDRTDGQLIAMDLVAHGIVVLSIDFRNAPEAPYPASLADINLGIRWLKANAHRFGSSPDRVGALGTSSGGHQAILAAIRPHDPRYRALPLTGEEDTDARLAFVISGWGVISPYDRYQIAKARGLQDLIKSHETFFKDEAEQREATPHLIIENGEEVYLPPALQFQGTEDQFTTVAQAERLATAYHSAGGHMETLLLDGERHTFVTEFPLRENSQKALAEVRRFIMRYGSGQR